MENIIEALGNQADRLNRRFAQPRIGIVASSDSGTSTARVLVQPENTLTGWLPVITLWAGAGWGLFAPPGVGDQVIVIFQEGDAAHGMIVGSFYSNSVRPPNVEPGELILKHRSGSSLTLKNSGVVVVSGDLHVSGNIFDSHGALDKLRASYNNHFHTTPNGVTSLPTPRD